MKEKNVGIKIRAAREAANLSLRRVAECLGRTSESVRLIEVGLRGVTPEKAQRILEAVAKLKTSRGTGRNPDIEPLAQRVRKGFLAAASELASGKR